VGPLDLSRIQTLAPLWAAVVTLDLGSFPVASLLGFLL
jgi:hypothetical protein